MRHWMPILAAAMVAVLGSSIATAADDSGFIWQSDQGVQWTGMTAAPLPFDTAVPGGQDSEQPPAKRSASQGKTAGEKTGAKGLAPEPAPIGQWKAPSTKKPEPKTLTEAMTSDSPKAPATPRTLPEDPAYQPPRPKAAPSTPVKKPSSPAKAPPKAPLNEETERPVVPPAVGPADQTSCDWCGQCGCAGTCTAGRRVIECGPCEDPCDPEEPWRLFDWPVLTCRGISIRGWTDMSYTANGDRPADRFNGPVTFTDRSNEFLMGQLYLIAERVTRTEGQGFDVGGRVDLLYGTDARFAMANGLDDDWIAGERFYRLAMPQLYADFALNDWVVRLGHFYSIAGYEVVPAINNFFHTHSYTFQYGEPFTHTGMLAKWQFNDRLALSAGFHRGWDQWEDNNDKIGLLAGASWDNPDWGTTIGFSLTVSNEQVDLTSTLTLYSIVLTQKLGERWKYVLQHDGAYESNAVATGLGRDSAEWFGVVNYLLFDLNERWSFGLRYEWFADNDGTRVRSPGYPYRFDFLPDPLFPAYWNEISLGANWKPHRNVLVRLETRWDWVDPIGTSAEFPFDDRTERHQFLFDANVVVQF